MNSPLSGASGVTRRAFLKASLAQGAAAMLVGPVVMDAARAVEPSAGLCVTICNHWSYIGIGWQLGIESCVLSANDALASTLGARSQAELLDEAWKHLLAAQSHDVGLCEYSRWQGDRMAPADRLEDFHNFTRGSIGYNHLDAAQQQARPLLDASLKHITSRINSRTDQRGVQAITVLNPLGWPRTDVLTTGRIYPIPAATRGLVMRNRSGQAFANQMVANTKDAEGNLVVAELAFLGTDLPSAGYDTYYLDFLPQVAPPAATALKIEESSLVMENEHLRVRLDPATGGVVAPANIKEGYWLSLRPAFPVTEVLRDFPFGVEETKNPTFHALTFVDLLGKDGGLLLLHSPDGVQHLRTWRQSTGSSSALSTGALSTPRQR